MKNKALLLFVCFVNYLFSLENNLASILSIENDSENETIITVSSQSHIDYGLSYPTTYEFSLPLNSSDLYAYRKSRMNEEWTQIEQKTNDDFFNGIEAARFDYDGNKAYISVQFSSLSDTLFIKLEDNDGNIVSSFIEKICEIYGQITYIIRTQFVNFLSKLYTCYGSKLYILLKNTMKCALSTL